MKINQEVAAELSGATIEGNTLTLTRELDRKLYPQVAKAIECLGGKWDRKAKCHLFPQSADVSALVDDAINSGEIADIVKELQFYQTPTSLAMQMVQLAGVKPESLVLEPSAGHGRIVRPLIEAGASVFAVEINPDCIPHLIERAGVSLHKLKYEIGDFLEREPSPIFDAVVMNPPFQGGRDIKHVEHALKFLKKGGRLVAVMAAGILFRLDRKHIEFRERVEELGGTITALPEGTFSESGTGVSTALVVIDC